MAENENPPSDFEEFMDGVRNLLTGCETAVRNVQAHVIAWQGGHQPKPVELHKLTSELKATIGELARARKLLALGEVERENPVSGGGDTDARVEESVANSTVRSQMLEGLGRMDNAVSSCRNGLSTAAAVLGAWAAGGLKPNSQELEQTHEGLQSGANAMDQLAADLRAFRQHVEWFESGYAPSRQISDE
jgi:hypothetical protein